MILFLRNIVFFRLFLRDIVFLDIKNKNFFSLKNIHDLKGYALKINLFTKSKYQLYYCFIGRHSNSYIFVFL